MSQSASGVEHDVSESHGHSTAAWTAVAIILAGSIIMALSVIFPSMAWFIIGAVVALLGVATGKVLAMAGYGAKKGHKSGRASGGREDAELPGRNQTDSGTT